MQVRKETKRDEMMKSLTRTGDLNGMKKVTLKICELLEAFGAKSEGFVNFRHDMAVSAIIKRDCRERLEISQSKEDPLDIMEFGFLKLKLNRSQIFILLQEFDNRRGLWDFCGLDID